MAIALTYLGAADDGGTTQTKSFSPSSGVSIGDLIVTAVFCWQTTYLTPTPEAPPFTDSKNNVYIPGLTATTGSGDGWGIGYSVATSELTTSDTITITGPVTSSYMSGIAARVTGASSSYYGGATAYPLGTTTPSISTAVSVNVGDLVIALAETGVEIPAAPGGDWITLHTYSGLGVLFSYQIATSSGVVTFNPTSSVSRNWRMAILAFPAASAAQAVSVAIGSRVSLSATVFSAPPPPDPGGTGGTLAPVITVPASSVRNTDLSISIVHADGTTDRWGPDEPDGRNVPDDLGFTTSIPGGFKDLTCSLQRELSVYPDQVPFDDLFVHGPGNDVMWNGYMSRFPFDESGVKPTALGWINSLTFDTRAREIYAERDMEKFTGEIPKNYRDVLGTTYNLEGASQIVPPNARVEFSFDRLANGNPPIGLVEAWFDGKGVTISKVYYNGTTFDRSTGTPTGAPWVWTINLSKDDSASAIDSASMVSGTSGYLSASNSVPAKYIVLAFYYNAAFTGDGDWRGYLNNVVAYGAHGLTGRGSDPVGFYPSDIIADIVKRWGTLLNYTYPGSIEQDTTFILPSFAQYDPGAGYDMLSAVNAFQLKDWGVYSGGEDSYPNRTFFLREPSPARLTWRARRSDGATLTDEGVDAENLVNGVVVNWTGYDGNTYSVGPPSSGCQFTSTALQDTDPTNPVNSHNLGVKYGRIDLSRKTDLVSATRVGSTWLSRRIGIQHRGTLMLRGWVRHPSGALVPVGQVRAGDYAIVEDDPRDQTARKIVNTTYSHRDRTMQCDLEYEAFRIDALIEQLGAEVYGSSVT